MAGHRHKYVPNSDSLSERTVNCLLNMTEEKIHIGGDFDNAPYADPAEIEGLGREYVSGFYQVGKKTLAEIEAWLALFGRGWPTNK